MGLKYIVMRVRDREWPIIFPDAMVHKDVAETVRWHLMRHHDQDCRVVSAGSFTCFGGVIRCGGESETLKIKSRGKTDVKLIALFDYNHGLMEGG